MESTAVTTLVPLLFLVVTQLAQVGRELDLKKAIGGDRNPLGIPVLDWVPGVPAFGQFNFVHGANLTQLTVGLVLITVLSEGWIKWGLTLLTWVMFVVLPVLEINCYNEIIELSEAPYTLPGSDLPFYSFHANLLMSTIITGVVFYFGGRLDPDRDPVKFVLDTPSLIALIGLIAIGYIVFLHILEEELELIDSVESTYGS